MNTHTDESSARILIVDDKPENLHLLTGILKEKGYHIRQLRDGNMVMLSVLNSPPDLILLDIMMPETDGYEVCRKLKNNKQTSDIPVIFISALGETTSKIKAFSAGGVDYITKPFQEEEVLLRVKTHLNLHRLQLQLESQNRRLTQEIESRKKAEASLVRSQSFLDKVINTLPNPLFVKDEQHRWIMLNDALCKFMGHKREELIGKSDYDIFPKEEADVFWEKDNLVYESGRSNTNEEQITDSAGETHTILTTKTIMLNESGEKILLGVITEITELRKAQERLESESRFRANIIQSAAEGICVIHSTQIYPYLHFSEWNDRMTDITGYQREEVNQKGWQMLFPDPAEQGKIIDRIEQVKDGMITEREEWNIVRQDGGKRVLSISTSPIETESGASCTLAMMHDLTDQKEAAETLHRAKNAADAANNAKSEFLANMSHEIRTPMNAVIGMTDLTLQTALTPIQKDYLQVVRESAHHLLHIINDILDLSKIEAGKLTLEEVDFDLFELLDSAIQLFSMQIEKKGLFLNQIRSDDVPRYIRGDQLRLKQILVNLISNAVKFTQTGGIVIIVKPVDDSSLLFSVTDTGIGIPKDRMERIFDSFSQAGDGTTRRFGGTGLGLSICRKMAELMGGRIRVKSEVGTGSTFSFSGIFRTGDKDRIRPENRQNQVIPDHAARKLKILLAEDNMMNAKVVSIFLTRMGHTPFQASNGQEVLAFLSSSSFDLLLMDVEMPKMNGLEATERIRRGEAGPENTNIPIIAITAHALSEFRDKCCAAGMNDFVTKPIDFSELGAVIEKNFAGAAGMSSKPPAEAKTEPRQLVWDKKDALHRCDGDEELLKRICGLFTDSLPGRIKKLRQSINSGDIKEIEMNAHSVKGMCGNMSAKICQDIAEQLERLARKGNNKPEQYLPLLNRLNRELDKVVMILDDI